MSHDDYFSSELPDDPDAAFVVLEEAFRTEVLAKKNARRQGLLFIYE